MHFLLCKTSKNRKNGDWGGGGAEGGELRE